MLREKYLNDGNIGRKVRRWLRILGSYRRNLAGGDFRKIALLVIDMQNFFLDRKSRAFLPSAPAIVPNVKKTIACFRRHGLPVVFTRHCSTLDGGMMERWWDGRGIVEGTRDSRIAGEVAPMEGDTVIRKGKYSAFHGTELGRILRSRSVKSVAITGVMTHLCCESTAREAFMRDLSVCFVVDGTASLNEGLHLSSLKTLSHGFAIPVLAGELIEKIEEAGC